MQIERGEEEECDLLDRECFLRRRATSDAMLAYQRSSGSLPWIEILAQAVADEIKRQHRERDGYAREDQRVRRSLKRR